MSDTFGGLLPADASFDALLARIDEADRRWQASRSSRDPVDPEA